MGHLKIWNWKKWPPNFRLQTSKMRLLLPPRGMRMVAKVSHTPLPVFAWLKTPLWVTRYRFYFPAGSPRLVSDSVKVAIEGRSEEQQADTFTPLIPQHAPTGASTTEAREGDDGGTGNLALYEVIVLHYYMHAWPNCAHNAGVVYWRVRIVPWYRV